MQGHLPKRWGKSSNATVPISHSLDENSSLERGIELPTFLRWQFCIQYLSPYSTSLREGILNYRIPIFTCMEWKDSQLLSVVSSPIIQCSWSGWPTGYGKKLSSTQEQLGKATCCWLVSFHFLWAILSTSTVDKLCLKKCSIQKYTTVEKLAKWVPFLAADEDLSSC